MTPSSKCYDLIKEFEDCVLKAYPDPKTGGAPWTCGWGQTGLDVMKGTVWTQAHADERLVASVDFYARLVTAKVTAPMTQGMFDAMVSIVFNVGPGSSAKDGILRLRNGQPSTLLKMLNDQNYAGAADQFTRWVSPGSNVENGLRRRREAEVKLFRS